MAPPADGELPPDKVGRWYEQGDPVAVYPALQIGDLSGQNYTPKNLPVPMIRTRYLFVKNIPDNWQGVPITIAKISGVLTSPHLLFNGDTEKMILWNFWADLSNGVKNALSSNGYDTVNFSQLKSALRRKDTQAIFSELDLLAD